MRRALAAAFVLIAALSVCKGRSEISVAYESSLPTVAAEKPRQDEIVAFNTHSLKYHCRACSSAKACTKNCIDIPLSEAKKRGGEACKRCGGTCGP